MRRSKAKKEMSELIDSLEEEIIKHKKLTWILRDITSQVIDQAYKDKVDIKDRSSLIYLLGLIVDQTFEDLSSD